LYVLAAVLLIMSVVTPAKPPQVHKSKLVYYRVGLMERIAARRGLAGTSPDGCYNSTPLPGYIGKRWTINGLRCVQADVPQPKHRQWQLDDNRLAEVNHGVYHTLAGTPKHLRADEVYVHIRAGW
jgi:hypothetical protein